MRSRHVSLPRARWRTTPGSLDPGASRAAADWRSWVTSSSTGCHASLVRSLPDATSRGATTATIAPSATGSPGARSSVRTTTPAQGAVTTASIFIALTTSSPSPGRTTSPSEAETATTVPAIGLRATCSSGPTASSGGRMLAGAGACVVRRRGAPGERCQRPDVEVAVGCRRSPAPAPRRGASCGHRRRARPGGRGSGAAAPGSSAHRRCAARSRLGACDRRRRSPMPRGSSRSPWRAAGRTPAAGRSRHSRIRRRVRLGRMAPGRRTACPSRWPPRAPARRSPGARRRRPGRRARARRAARRGRSGTGRRRGRCPSPAR